jgi:mannose-6-phosphate isomerase-like protein (cupin superfamily)
MLYGNGRPCASLIPWQAPRPDVKTKQKRLKFAAFDDERGRVVPIEHAHPDLPFTPVRSFVICNVPQGRSRAGHRTTCDEVLTLVSGSLTVEVKEGEGVERHPLAAPGESLHVREGTWIALRDFAQGTVVLVLAAKPYGRR